MEIKRHPERGFVAQGDTVDFGSAIVPLTVQTRVELAESRVYIFIRAVKRNIQTADSEPDGRESATGGLPDELLHAELPASRQLHRPQLFHTPQRTANHHEQQTHQN